jgi:hypothetical protein
LLVKSARSGRSASWEKVKKHQKGKKDSCRTGSEKNVREKSLDEVCEVCARSKFVPEEKGIRRTLVQEVQRQRAHSPRSRFTERSLSQIQRLGGSHQAGDLVAAEAGGVGQLAGLKTSGLRGAAGERPGAVAAVGWASSGSGSGHTGCLVVVLIVAGVILVVVRAIIVSTAALAVGVIPAVVRVMLVGAAVLETGVILVVTCAGARARSGSRSRRSGLTVSCISTGAPPRHERNLYIPQ